TRSPAGQLTTTPGSPTATPTSAGTTTAGTTTAGTSGAAATSSPPPAGTGTRCRTGDLAASLRPEDSAAGNRYAMLMLANTSRRTCTLYGYGGIQLATAERRAVPTLQRRDPAHPAR